jgi:tetratricopeptide (TPR) repeat protein
MTAYEAGRLTGLTVWYMGVVIVCLGVPTFAIYTIVGLKFKKPSQKLTLTAGIIIGIILLISVLNLFLGFSEGFKASAYYRDGVANYHKGKYSEAISYYDKALNIDPKYALAYNARGLAYTDIGSFDKAINNFNSALKLRPDEGTLYLNRGLVYLKKGDSERAHADYNQAIKINPKLIKQNKN